MRLGKTWMFALLLTVSTMAFAQDDGSSSEDTKGGFELGALGMLILPSHVPGADEVYPAFGPHFGLPMSFGTLELQAIAGFKKDSDGGGSNRLLYVPIGARFDFADKGLPGFLTAGAHAVYYHTHSAAGTAMDGTTGGVNLGGGIIFKDRSLRYRFDFRVYARPGWAVTIGFIGFFTI